MQLVVYNKSDKHTKKRVGVIFVCNGCREKSTIRKKPGLPKRWVEKTELQYNHQGRHVLRSGWIVNYYCPCCHSNGVTARTVAATTKKFYRMGLIKNKFH